MYPRRLRNGPIRFLHCLLFQEHIMTSNPTQLVLAYSNLILPFQRPRKKFKQRTAALYDVPHLQPLFDNHNHRPISWSEISIIAFYRLSGERMSSSKEHYERLYIKLHNIHDDSHIYSRDLQTSMLRCVEYLHIRNHMSTRYWYKQRKTGILFFRHISASTSLTSRKGVLNIRSINLCWAVGESTLSFHLVDKRTSTPPGRSILGTNPRNR